MRISTMVFPEVKLLTPEAHFDHRGFFTEVFNQKAFNSAIGETVTFVQDNLTRSSRGVLRGLHYQLGVHAQGKLVQVVSGEIFDVVVDVRKDSSTKGHWFALYLNSESRQQLWIPRGFAHGFLAISRTADVLYKTDEYWNKGSERSIAWNCPEIAVDWPLSSPPALSSRDATSPCLSGAELI